MPTRCQATNQAGQPCSAQHWRDGWCRWHSPELEHERREWSRAGGRGKSNKRRAKKALPDNVLTPTEVQGMLGLALRGVLAGRLEPGVANAAANLGRALVAVREATALADEVAAIKEAIGLGSERTA